MNELRRHWHLDEDVVFLNHGSFGACPRAVLALQTRLREQLECEPVRFFTREAPAMLAEARAMLGDFVGADPMDLAFVPNVTSALNSVLRSFPLEEGDEILVTDHQYNATSNAARFVAERCGARVVVARVPFPLESPDEVATAVLPCLGARTRLAVLDHVTSQTGLVFPIEDLVAALRARGVRVLVDGAHAPGMLPLDVEAVGADYYAANCHKWLCAPKGVGFLWVRRELQAEVRPAIISHGANAGADEARFRAEFDWLGTDDPTPALALPEAIRLLASFVPGGWHEIRERNRTLTLAGRRLVADALGVSLPCPDAMVGSLAALPVPETERFPATRSLSALDLDPLHEALFRQHGIEVPVLACPAHPGRMIRTSAALYNDLTDFERLAEALRRLLRG